MDNIRTYNPVVIQNTNSNVTYLPPNANYSMTGSETYVNSGFIGPYEQAPADAAPITSFSLSTILGLSIIFVHASLDDRFSKSGIIIKKYSTLFF